MSHLELSGRDMENLYIFVGGGATFKCLFKANHNSRLRGSAEVRERSHPELLSLPAARSLLPPPLLCI